MNEKNPNTIKENILSKIGMNELVMKPRVYFTLRAFGIACVALLVLLVSVLICNFILFSVRVNNHDTLLLFGTEGLVLFLKFFPWPLLVLDIALIAFLEWLLKQFRFGYRKPTLYLVLASVALVISLGVALDRATDVNDQLMARAVERGLPTPFGDFYTHVRQAPPPGSLLCKCVVSAIDGDVIFAYDAVLGTTTMFSVHALEGPRGTPSLRVGDVIFIAGTRDGERIEAFGIHELPQQHPLFHGKKVKS